MSKNTIHFFRVTAVQDVHASGPPCRILRIRFNFINPLDERVIIVNSWATVATIGGATVGEGSVLRLHTSDLDPKAEGYGELAMPLTPWALRYIERRRGGGDVGLRITSEILALRHHHDDQSASPLAPVRGQLDQGKTGRFTHKIPQSEWIKILRALQWSELELLEIPSRNLRALPIPPRALGRFEDAQRLYRRGAWAEAMASCRKSFEALVKEVSEDDDMARAPEVLSELLAEDKRANALNDAIRGLSRFLHLARHEQEPAIHVGPADATFAIRITGSLLAYLGEYREPA